MTILRPTTESLAALRALKLMRTPAGNYSLLAAADLRLCHAPRELMAFLFRLSEINRANTLQDNHISPLNVCLEVNGLI